MSDKENEENQPVKFSIELSILKEIWKQLERARVPRITYGGTHHEMTERALQATLETLGSVQRQIQNVVFPYPYMIEQLLDEMENE